MPQQNLNDNETHELFLKLAVLLFNKAQTDTIYDKHKPTEVRVALTEDLGLQMAKYAVSYYKKYPNTLTNQEVNELLRLFIHKLELSNNKNGTITDLPVSQAQPNGHDIGDYADSLKYYGFYRYETKPKLTGLTRKEYFMGLM